MSSIFKSIAKVVLPNLGAVGGALNGLVQGGGLKGALQGGLQSGLSAAASLAGSQLLPSALGSPSTTINWTSGVPGSTLGTQTLGGSGILGGLSSSGSFGNALSQGLSKATSTGNGLGFAGNLFSAFNANDAYEDAARYQLAGTNKALAANAPFLQTGTLANDRLSSLLGLGGENYEDILEILRSSPGYQFRLEQGQDALNKSLAARGLTYSGQAIKEAQRLGQGLADQTYQDYLNDLTRQSAAGQQAAGVAGGYEQDKGNILANRDIYQSNSLDQALANIFSSNVGSAQGGKRLIGYDPNTGMPIYG